MIKCNPSQSSFPFINEMLVLYQNILVKEQTFIQLNRCHISHNKRKVIKTPLSLWTITISSDMSYSNIINNNLNTIKDNNTLYQRWQMCNPFNSLWCNKVLINYILLWGKILLLIKDSLIIHSGINKCTLLWGSLNLKKCTIRITTSLPLLNQLCFNSNCSNSHVKILSLLLLLTSIATIPLLHSLPNNPSHIYLTNILITLKSRPIISSFRMTNHTNTTTCSNSSLIKDSYPWKSL